MSQLYYGVPIELDEEKNKFVNVPKFIHPFTCLIAGPTSSGKSTFVKNLIEAREEDIFPQPNRIFWFYSQWQPLYEHVHGVNFQQGIPESVDSFDPEDKTLIIIDDLMSQVNSEVVELFTKGSHHRNISVVYIVQNLFHSGKEHRTISLNSHYMVLFKNPRDSSQISHLARQIFPDKPNFLQKVYHEATSEPYGYLFIDLKQDTPESMRLRSHLFDPVTYIYVMSTY